MLNLLLSNLPQTGKVDGTKILPFLSCLREFIFERFYSQSHALLCKIYRNTGFLWPVFSCIVERLNFRIVSGESRETLRNCAFSEYRKIRARENPYSSIFYAVNLWDGITLSTKNYEEIYSWATLLHFNVLQSKVNDNGYMALYLIF